ncbi:MAG: lipopolysaccharide kinase InaA family protein [Verrucomicrobiia bacterium]|jgi:tRNA A-37 threonylcarbamoyl transferase component Bud32
MIPMSVGHLLVDDRPGLPYDGDVLRKSHQGFRWEFAPQFESLLAEVLQEPAEPVKISSATTVTRRHVANREFYIKRYLHERRGLAPVAYFIRSDKSRREWTFAPKFQTRGIPVVPHLAHGERWGWYGLLESVLITEGLPGYAPLLTLPESMATEVQRALGRFLRQMHDAGIVYLDISPKNVLYSASEIKFCLIDIDKAQFHDALNEQQRIHHITVFHSRFPLTAAFYDGYGNDVARHAADIDSQAAAIERARVARLSRICLKHRHEVTTRRIGGSKWHIRLADLDENLERVLREPDNEAGSASGFVVTRLAYRSGKEAYRRAYGKELSGEPAPRPVAAADKRVLGVVVRGYFVTKAP